MTDEELKTIEERAAKAAPGPWEASGFERPDGAVLSALLGPRDSPEQEDYQRMLFDVDTRHPDMATGEFIAHARSDVPALAAEVRRLRQAMTEAEAQVSSEYGEAAGRKLRAALGADPCRHLFALAGAADRPFRMCTLCRATLPGGYDEG